MFCCVIVIKIDVGFCLGMVVCFDLFSGGCVCLLGIADLLFVFLV